VARFLANIYRLGIKELFSLRRDPVMVFLIVYMFTIAVFTEAQNAAVAVRNVAVAIVDEDRSQLSRRISDAFLQPYFQAPVLLQHAMEASRFTFVIDIPPDFQADILAGRQPVIQLNVDATAMSVAGTGAGYIQRIILQELSVFVEGEEVTQPVNIVTRASFNPNMNSTWFQGVMSPINKIALLAILLTGAALIREREHGTIEHLLAMPLRPVEIMLAKVWANSLVVVIAMMLSLYLVVQGALSVPISGSILLFLAGAIIYLFSVSSLGIFLATLARSMPQFGFMLLLSGGNTPLESMPEIVQFIMQFVPSAHFISTAQAVLLRGAGLDAVWPSLVATGAIGVVLFLAALVRLRKTVSLA
jgi:ABC-2 type transport system permease protein